MLRKFWAGLQMDITTDALDLLMYSHQKLFTFICIHSQYKAELQKMHVSVLQLG